jgi:DNA-binding FadR family transcriptional regulator
VPESAAAGSLALGSYAAVFAPVTGSRRADAVARRLGDSIALGLLPDASPLPAEADLAERFGVATVTVRDALAVLRDDGLIRTRRGRRGGSFVRAPSDGGRATLLTRLRATALGDLRDAADHYAAIVSACARLAALRADDGDLVRLRHLAGHPEGSAGPLARVEGQFHLDLAAAAQSARLTREEMSLQAEFGPVLWLANTLGDGPSSTPAGHLGIVDAVAAGEPDPAGAAAERHVTDLFAAVRTLHREARRQ